MKTFIEVAFEVLACAVLVIGMITIFAGAVLQESYKNYPPTAEEIADNSELVRYAKWAGNNTQQEVVWGKRQWLMITIIQRRK